MVTTEKAARQPQPAPETLQAIRIPVRVGQSLPMDELVRRLVDFGYESQGSGRPGESAVVTGRGQFARRGGILDIFPFQGEWPVRLEFDGDRVESLRVFDIGPQTSIRALTEVAIFGLQTTTFTQSGTTLRDYLQGDWVVWREPADVHEAVTVHFGKPGDAGLGPGVGAECLRRREEGGVKGAGDETSRKRDRPIASLGPVAEGIRLLQDPNACDVPSRPPIQESLNLELFHHEFLATGMMDAVLQEQRRELLLRHWRDWLEAGWRIHVFCNNEGEEQRLRELLANEGTSPGVAWQQGHLLHGFCWPRAGLVVLSDAEIFGRYQTLGMLRAEKRMARARLQREAIDFSQFNEGDRVVHVNHGVARFVGIRKVDLEGREHEVLSLEYAEGALLHVPIEQAHLVGRYVGVGKRSATLDELGGSRWEKARIRAQRAVMDYAAKLLKVQAERQHFSGFAFPKDTAWQREFEDAFLYEETPDQVTAISETKEDMEATRPMDRLICGDVGFGKTEVAIRAAFKAVMSGKQVAVLAPTTVLAQQHERTFRERMADYPVRIDLLSRFRSRKEQRQTLEALKRGAVDIVIGTHRLIQPDVVFKNLGLVVVDEEQRFGVEHKERFKETFHLIDMLTLSATPIPRTLYLALLGARDMSQIETPPPNRLPVETTVAPYDERLIRSAIEHELARGGQVFFLHNRVRTISHIRDRVRELVPQARVEIAHGQMEEDELEAVMLRFVAGEIDVLCSTTIIESGLDIPRANTILIDRADRFGLADLYQLRGRVGRSQAKAYAWLFLPRHLMLEAHARKRVSAIRQYSQLGAGFKVAMRDLEIRGAGNILGTEQSGHATAIGFELYCQLLRETVARMKGEKRPPRVEVRIRLDFLPLSEDLAEDGVGAFVPRAYMAESRQRIDAYRRIAEVAREKELQALLGEWTDRYGKPPLPVRRLIAVARVRLAAAAARIVSIEVEDGKVMLQRGGSLISIGNRLPRLAAASPDDRIEELRKLVGELGG
jgi:transcription-repair coupling factor (superfamily II helicase)